MGDNVNIKNRIVKNTLLLYTRTFISMIVSIYTSRVILNALGEVNLGVYSVVGGIVGMMSFLNGALAGASSRYITFALGKNDAEELNQIFSASLNLHIFLAIIIVILNETIGLWFLYNKLVIPPEQINAAFWVLQFSVVTAVMSIITVPYSASLISHENMSIYAYMGLYDAFSKLTISWLITAFGTKERLFFYALLLMVSSIIPIIIYRIYAYRHYPECRWRKVKDKRIYKGLTSYSAWDMLGNISLVCQGSGISFLLNIFFGPVANTARVISDQIQNAVTLFVGNFTTASRPRVIKYCAEGNYHNMYRLTFITSKIAFFLVLILALPIMFELKYILKLWLGDVVPPYTYSFTIIILITALFQSFHTSYLMCFHAIGRIKTGNLICGTLRILALPISYIALKLHAPAYSVFIIILIVNFTCHIISWYIVHRYIHFNVRNMIRTIYIPCVAVTILAIIAPTIITTTFDSNFMRFIIVIISTELILLPTIYFIGFNKHDRNSTIKPMFKRVVTKIFHNKHKS